MGIKKHDPTICYLQKNRFRSKDTSRLKIKEQNKMKILHVNNNQKRTK